MKLIRSHRLTRFIIVGGTAALVEYVVFLTLHHLGFVLIVANSISFGCGLLVSYVFNRMWVFKSSGRRHTEFLSYVTLALVNLVASNLLVYAEVKALMIAVVAAKPAAMVVIAGWNYFIFPRLIFRSETSSHDQKD